jgi:N-acetylglucosaminyl-diphospho-decaprenol L-rhamnosyltransferase
MSRAGGGLDMLTAIVLNWNQSELTIRAVQSLIDDGVPASRIVVVDNGSDDGSWERISSRLHRCHRMRITENVGFARGNNAAARVLDGAAYLFVNSDAFVHREGSTAALVGALDRHHAGIVVPRLLNANLTLQRSVVPAHRPSVALVRASGLSRFVPNRFQPHWGTHWDHRSSREVDCAIGPVLLVRRSLWHELGGFPETSFMYAEDLGLCVAATEHGSMVWFCSEAEFVHVGGGSTSARWDDEARAEHVGRANASLIREHLPPLDAHLTLAITRAGLAVRLGYQRLAGNSAAAANHRGSLRGYGSCVTVNSDATQQEEPEVTVLPPEESS